MSLLVARAVTVVTDAHLTAGVLGMRLAAVAGLVLLALALPVLARACGVQDFAAFWRGGGPVLARRS